MDYGDILRRAWRITWRHQAMWLFGLMVVWTFPSIISNALAGEAQGGLAGLLYGVSPGAAMWTSFLWSLFIAVAGAVIHAFGRASLVYQANQAEGGIEPRVRTGWEGGTRYFLRVLVITFVLALPVIVVVFVAIAVAFIAGFMTYWQQVQPDALPDPSVLNLMCGCFGPTICVGVLLGVVLSTVQILATRACVLDDRGIWQSIVAGWGFFRANLGSVLMFLGMWLLIGIGLGVLLMIPICLFVTLVGGMALTGSQWDFISSLLSGSVSVNLPWWVVSMGLGSVWCTFHSTAWTLFYRDLSTPPQPEAAMPALDQGVL